MRKQLLLVCFFVCVFPTWAIFADEVGELDWYKQYVGKVNFAHLHKQQIYVATQQNVIASLNANNGDIVWRQVLPQSGGDIEHFLHCDQTLLVVQPRHIRLFSVSGALLWEQFMANNISGTLLIPPKEGDHCDVVIQDVSGIALYIGSSGAKAWYKESAQKYISAHLYAEKGLVYVAGITLIELHIISISTAGVITQEYNIVAEGEKFSAISVSSDGYALVVGAQRLYSHKLGSGNAFTAIQKTQDLLGFKHLPTSVVPYGFVYKMTNETILISKELKICCRLPAGSSFTETLEGLVLGVHVEEDSIYVSTFIVPTKSIKLTNLNISIHGVPIAQYAIGSRILVVFQDWAICMVDEMGALKWVREESLSSISACEILDLPSDIAHFQAEDPHTQPLVSIYWSRVTTWLAHLQNTFVPQKVVGVSSSPMAKDQFGFIKLIVALTASGKIVALSTDRGQVLWGKMMYIGVDAQLYVTRTGAHAECTIVYSNKVVVVDLGDGTLISEVIMDYASVVQVIPLSTHDSTFRKVLLLKGISKSGEPAIRVFPDNEETKALALSQDLYFYEVDAQRNALHGFNLAFNYTWSLPPLWLVNFTRTHYDERLVAAAGSHNEHFHHPVIILGDRNILPKYSYRNMLAVATTVTQHSLLHLNIYILDAVTGSIIYHIHHADCGGGNTTIHLVENSLLYTYWNSKSLRHEVSVLDLYDRSVDWSSTEAQHYNVESSSSMIAYQQSFILPTGVVAIAHTATQRGITAKNILLGSTAGRILAIERRWLDARRPLPHQWQTMSASEKEELQIPYTSKLTFPVNTLITYNRTIERLHRITSWGTHLESTSLVFANGLDLFLTRVSPAEAYDLLNKDFNFGALIASILVLITGTLVSINMAKRKDLGKLWK